jgi:glycosyltransferase involved in cell wall biosynthesis
MSETLTNLLAEIETTAPESSLKLVISDDDVPVTQVQAEPPAKRGKLCLNMIVKNESRIITRLLDSVKSIIDCFCICDTGSTDDTADIIRKWGKEHNIPGEVYLEPFKNFGYNRTHALDRAERWGEYALLLDADMKLVIEPGFKKEDLKENGYSIIQKNGTLDYYNTRIAKTGIGVKCVGPTHEYYDFPSGGGHKLNTLWINDIGDGGCKSDKYERDIRLLTEALKTDSCNGRYYFYLAQSYNHIGNKEKAFEFYKKRVEIGGWVEEVFYAALEAGNMARELKRDAEAVYWWMEAYNRHPKRSESIHELAKFYRETSRNHLSQMFTDLGKSIKYPKDDVLFIKKACYDYLFDYEISINNYYTGRSVNHYDYINLLEKDYHRDNVISNYKFYVKKVKDFKDAKVIDFNGSTVKSIMGRDDDFVSSSPCIIPMADGYLMNVRYVNYKIRPDGSYAFKHSDGKITTLNLLQWLNRDFKVLKSKWIDQVQDETLRYQGVEDVKIFAHCDSILFCGTVENPENGNIAVGHGALDFNSDRLSSRAWPSPNGRRCEKNWCYFHTADGDLRMIYDWSPLTIASPEKDAIKILSCDAEVPKIFKDLRGSSNGCLVGDEIWFLTHYVQYCTPRHYYHMIVVLDAKTLKFKRNSILFKFQGECIEYSLGFLVEADRAIFTYSTMDRTSSLISISRETMEKELFPAK